MPLLDRAGWRTDDFSRGDVDGGIIVPLAALRSTLDARRAGVIGVEISNDVAVDRLAPYFAQLALIAIAFPAFGDGRGFSLARRLRQAGFAGRLRAVGPLIPDQGPYAFACGFDEIELPEASLARQSEAQWAAAIGAISHAYQPGYARQTSIFERRRAARAHKQESRSHA